MTPETPILTIALQIPVLPETTTDKVLDSIAQKVSMALEEIRRQQSAPDPEPISQAEFNAWILKEVEEAYTEKTKGDLLATLGYESQD